MSFHELHTDIPKPDKFTYPFYYVPHPLCRLAAQQVQDYLAKTVEWHEELCRGKMFGVLVVETKDGLLGYVAAYSGLLAGRNDHPFFVPPVFDSQQPNGRFKRGEAEISAINKRINDILESEEYKIVVAEYERCREDIAKEEAAFREKMKLAKSRRDARRHSIECISDEDEQQMIRESQFMKAELRRIRKRNAVRLAAIDSKKAIFENKIVALKTQRKNMSDTLQQWLFSQYDMLNALGEKRNLLSIFADTAQRVPPSGAGDCCAPKLLQYAYLHDLRPVCMAEFWWGNSPKTEIRHHLHFYPACRGKCLPILSHMLQGLDVERCDIGCYGVTQPLEIVYEDDWLAVVNKPVGMKSVEGRDGVESVSELLRKRSSKLDEIFVVHRLDMDTSGLLLVAKTKQIYTDLQAQFADRQVRKWYVALLEGEIDGPGHGKISIPLYSDPLDRPYQKVDYIHGKEAVTEYQVISVVGNTTRIALYPHTGRTHQLRVHCAHPDGLGHPIKGDRLYGNPSDRLYLHAEAISFVHPALNKKMEFERKAPF